MPQKKFKWRVVAIGASAEVEAVSELFKHSIRYRNGPPLSYQFRNRRHAPEEVPISTINPYDP